MSTLQDIGEFGLIDRLTALALPTPDVIEGLGDDCAVVRAGSQNILVSCDLSVENIHFRRSFASAREIGWKAAAASVSDIAAMGGKPVCMVVALACPIHTPLDFLQDLFRGIQDLAAEMGMAVVGGDTTRSTDAISLDVTVIGVPSGERYLLRRGAKDGDILFATGPLGLSSAGLRALETGKSASKLVHAHLHPVPRIEEGNWLCANPSVHAAIDISDGLVQDAGHIAKASHIGINIEESAVSVDAAITAFCDEHDLDARTFVLAGGEDYELLVAIEPNAAESIANGFSRKFNRPLHRIGACTSRWSGVRIDGHEPNLRGFDHFRGK